MYFGLRLVRASCLLLVTSALVTSAFAVSLTVSPVLRQRASEYLLDQLTYSRSLPDDSDRLFDVLYVLGGTPDSLEAKFKVAANLLRQGKAALLLVSSENTRMRFSADLGRNMTWNEWVLSELKKLGIGSDAVRLVILEEGFFGTWSEAKAVSRLVREEGNGRLILVTAPYHSRRVWESFSHTTRNPEMRLFLYLSDERVYLRNLFVEYVKLQVYRLLFL